MFPVAKEEDLIHTREVWDLTESPAKQADKLRMAAQWTWVVLRPAKSTMPLTKEQL